MAAVVRRRLASISSLRKRSAALLIVGALASTSRLVAGSCPRSISPRIARASRLAASTVHVPCLPMVNQRWRAPTRVLSTYMRSRRCRRTPKPATVLSHTIEPGCRASTVRFVILATRDDMVALASSNHIATRLASNKAWQCVVRELFRAENQGFFVATRSQAGAELKFPKLGVTGSNPVGVANPKSFCNSIWELCQGFSESVCLWHPKPDI